MDDNLGQYMSAYLIAWEGDDLEALVGILLLQVHQLCDISVSS